jgi:hypothetical protein
MLNFDVVRLWVIDCVVKLTTKTKHVPKVCNLRWMQGSVFPISIILRIVKGSNRSQATVCVVSLGVHCHTLNGPAPDLWLLVCVHTTCGCYENCKSTNTHCGCHLTSRWRAYRRHYSVASIVRLSECQAHTHTHLVSVVWNFRAVVAFSFRHFWF